ncbi:MAG: magnesium/cobalt transporter CorA [Planctomycetota bacterium]|jgi:magnesium transporter
MATRRQAKRRIPFIRLKRPPGTRPGTLVVDPTAPMPVISAIAYGPDECHELHPQDSSELKDVLGKQPVVWINVEGLGDTELISKIGELFSVHRLALEDVVNAYQRAKVEPYEAHLFVVARMVHGGERLETEQVSFFVGEDYVLTFHERPGDCFDLVRQRLRSGRGRIRGAGASYMAYALLDALIDAYFPVLETYGERIEALESEVLTEPGPEVVGRIHAVKRDLLVLRRAIWPHREMANALLRDDSPFITDQTRVYLRDCYDHTVQLLDIVETYRELASGLLDVYLSSLSNRMNEIMKVLTIFAAIFIPLTFIAGIFGMNFEWMPELGLKWAYPATLALMSALAVVMLVFFRTKGWIGNGGKTPSGDEQAEPPPGDQTP